MLEQCWNSTSFPSPELWEKLALGGSDSWKHQRDLQEDRDHPSLIPALTGWLKSD
jgi:hypothetical protein